MKRSFLLYCLMAINCVLSLAAEDRLITILSEAEALKIPLLTDIVRVNKLQDLRLEDQAEFAVRVIFYHHAPAIFELQLRRDKNVGRARVRTWRRTGASSGPLLVLVESELTVEAKNLEAITKRISKAQQQGSVLFTNFGKEQRSNTGVILEIITQNNYIVRTIELEPNDEQGVQFGNSLEYKLVLDISRLAGIGALWDAHAKKAAK